MDFSPAFAPGFDADGKRARALSLYGVDGRFRASDAFAVALDRVVACAVRFTDASGATLALWPGLDPVVVARAGAEVPATALLDQWHLPGGDGDPSQSTGPWTDSTRQVVGTAVVGHDGLRLGLLAVVRPAAPALDRETGWLLETLARAATAALDERRRVVSRRREPVPPALRLLGAPDRRRPTP